MTGQRLPALRSALVARWACLGLRLILVGSVLLASPHLVRAQSSDITVAVDDVDTSAFPTVRIHVSVRDQNGVPIPGLTAEHFEIVEDGTMASRPKGVQADTNPNAQVSLAILVDLYRTLRGQPIESAQQATQELLTDLLDTPDDPDRAAFIGVHQELTTDPSDIDEMYEVPFTNDRNRLLNVVNFLHERIEDTGPGTPLYDAVIKAIRMAEASEPVAHRAVIVMTDGEDRGSISRDSDTIQRAASARTPVFTVGLSNSALDEQYLRRLAENTGGVYQAAETPDDLSSLFSNVLTTLRTQYVLSYDSALPEDGGTHSLLVRARTPTQLEGFQEQRVSVPGVVAEEVQEEASPTAESPAAGAESETETEPVEDADGGLAAARDWVQDNLLLAGLAFGALVLLLLALMTVGAIVVRRRRARDEERVSPLAVPEYPSGSDLSFDSEPYDLAADANDGGTALKGTESASPATVMDDEPAIGVSPFPRYEEPAAPPDFAPPPFQPSSADRTRILQRTPKMPTVGLLIDRDHPGNRLDIVKPVVSIGRAGNSDVVVDHNTVSRQHAVVKWEEEQFLLYDMGSTNGTFVDDRRVREPVILEDGSSVRFGDKAFLFKVIPLET